LDVAFEAFFYGFSECLLSFLSFLSSFSSFFSCLASNSENNLVEFAVIGHSFVTFLPASNNLMIFGKLALNVEISSKSQFGLASTSDQFVEFNELFN
jgi:hypothetical protein